MTKKRQKPEKQAKPPQKPTPEAIAKANAAARDRISSPVGWVLRDNKGNVIFDGTKEAK